MRILFLYDFPIKGGGSGTYIKYLGLRLKERYKDKIAIVLPDKNEVDPGFTQYYVPVKQPPVFIGRPGLEKSKRYAELTNAEIAEMYHAYIMTTIRAVEEFRPDVIHVHHLAVNAWAARFIRSLYGTKLVITSHGSCIQNVTQDRRYFKMSKDALRAANVITAVSGDNKAKILKMFGEEFDAKMRTTPGGIRASMFPSSVKPNILEDIRVRYRIPAGPLVLFSGRLISEKGVEYIIKAAKLIKGHVAIAGAGIEKEKYKQLIKSMGLKNVQLLGYVDHATLVNIYYLADIFVSPSIWDDPMPLTIIEAMAARCSLVVTKKGGIPLAVKDGYNGYFVRPRSSKQIAEKVNKLLADPALRKKMGERARQIVFKKFTWSHVADRFHKVYTGI